MESTNKTLEGIITKTVAMNIKNWEEKLKDALWAYRITWKNTIELTPYQLVYSKEVMLPIESQIHTFKMAADLGIDLNEAQQERIQQLNQLDEMRQQAEETTILMQKQRNSGMMHISRRSSSKKETGLYFFTLNLEIIKPNSPHIGWAHTKSFKFMTMDQSSSLPLMEKATPLLSMAIA